MKKITATCLYKEGIHARPASELVRICQPVKSDIIIRKDGAEGNPKSILSLMSLGISYNDSLTIEISGADEAEAASSIEAFFKQS
ncbi:HPr family phosphocarrier protein [Fusibacter ferrireducens]|uniref:Phosphocarrier protein HPr n=1 Tax=Fusibacter ferrireducens TaxID=2785058 RepID=A0ABR9ZWK6_9FIRM|nr:HPr family phosphocarrier protein [Fusibacter ferrireducens]MBF4694852.1 HPr family phosphocarrier protein [Fusibacter ferrireducens]